MRVAFFIPYLSGGGGIARSSINLASVFIKQGYAVDFIQIATKKSLSESDIPPAINVITLQNSRTIFSVFKLRKYFTQHTPEIVISAQHHANITAILAKMLSRYKPKLIITERVAIEEALQQDGWHKRRILKCLMKLLYRYANSVVANSVAGARMLENLLGWRHQSVHAIYNIVDYKQIEVLRDEPIKKPFSNQNRPLLVAVGRLEYQKGFDLLLQAIAKLKSKLECDLVLVGDGTLKDELAQIVRELDLEQNVCFVGFKSNPYPYIKQANLFVLSSRYEGLGNIVAEAQACNTLVLATDCQTGPREILMDGKAGVLVPPNDAAKLAEGISSALNLKPAKVAELRLTATANLNRFGDLVVYNAYVDTVQK